MTDKPYHGAIDNSRRGFGVYVHYPYCRRICPFCDFVVYKRSKRAEAAGQDGRYVDALLRELAMRAPSFCEHRLTSIYLGGGTPSLLHHRLVNRLLEAMFARFDVAEDVEVTLEVDPTTVTTEDIQELVRSGVNRLSLGIQSFNDELLEVLGRGYLGRDAIKLIEDANYCNVSRMSADLLYGIPGQTLEHWQSDLERLVSYPKITHLSLYNLTVDEGGRFTKRLCQMGRSMPDEQHQAKLFTFAIEYLAERGLHQYEVSNWAAEGFQAIHNSGYWLRRPYLGLGVGAHSYMDRPQEPLRFSNTSNLKSYLALVESGRLPTGMFEELTKENRELELIMLGLRKRSGIPRHEMPYHYHSLIEPHLRAGLLEWRDNHLRFTVEGMLLSDTILADLVP